MKHSSDIIISDLCKSFDGQAVLSRLNLTLPSGASYCLMAPSGTGKTTLFKILLGLEQPDAGFIDGLSGKKITAVFQEDRLLEGYNAVQNLRFVTDRTKTTAQLAAFASRLLPPESLNKPVFEFSGGMKRRLALLRALAVPFDFLLLDEPFTGMDAATKQTAAELILEYKKNATLLFSAHDPKDALLLKSEIITIP